MCWCLQFDALPLVLQEQIAAEVATFRHSHIFNLRSCSRLWRNLCNQLITLATVPADKHTVAIPFLNSLPRLEGVTVRGRNTPSVVIGGMAMSSLRVGLKSLSLTSECCVKTTHGLVPEPSQVGVFCKGVAQVEPSSDMEEEQEKAAERKVVENDRCKLVIKSLGVLLQPWRHCLQHLHLNNCHVTGCEQWCQSVEGSRSLFAQFPHLLTLHLVSLSARTTPRVTYFNLSGCKALKLFDCRGSNVSDLELTGCGDLEHLHCQRNVMSTLSLSDCPKLVSVDCQHNLLTSVSVARCTRLKHLQCSSNKLAYIALNSSALLDTMDCAGRGHCPVILGGAVIFDLKCTANTLKWSHQVPRQRLVRLSLRHSFLTTHTEDDFRDLKFLRCKFGPTGDGVMILRGCTAVEVDCHCEATKVPGLFHVVGSYSVETLTLKQLGKWSPDLRKFCKLRHLHLTLQSQVSLDLSDCFTLQKLKLSTVSGVDCPLATINLSGCALLEEVMCDDFHQLENINLMSCVSLTSLSCKGSFLESLDMSQCSALKLVEISGSHRFRCLVQATAMLIWRSELSVVRR